jgi:uncharacterized peroxidase-related enzyme
MIMTCHFGTPTLSWLRLAKRAPVSPAMREIFEVTEAKLGYVRNQQRVFAHKPSIFAALAQLSAAVTQDKESALTSLERELIALVVSAENRCEACVFGHAAALRGLTGDPEWVATIEVNYRRAKLTERERALADYAVKLTRAAAEVEPADLNLLRDAGVSETGILEAASVAAYFNLSNRLNSGLGIRANREAYAAHR